MASLGTVNIFSPSYLLLFKANGRVRTDKDPTSIIKSQIITVNDFSEVPILILSFLADAHLVRSVLNILESRLNL